MNPHLFGGGFIFIGMNIRKIIREEIDDFDWISNVSFIDNLRPGRNAIIMPKDAEDKLSVLKQMEEDGYVSEDYNPKGQFTSEGDSNIRFINWFYDEEKRSWVDRIGMIFVLHTDAGWPRKLITGWGQDYSKTELINTYKNMRSGGYGGTLYDDYKDELQSTNYVKWDGSDMNEHGLNESEDFDWIEDTPNYKRVSTWNGTIGSRTTPQYGDVYLYTDDEGIKREVKVGGLTSKYRTKNYKGEWFGSDGEIRFYDASISDEEIDALNKDPEYPDPFEGKFGITISRREYNDKVRKGEILIRPGSDYNLIESEDLGWIKEVPSHKLYDACEVIDHIEVGDVVYLTGLAYYSDDDSDDPNDMDIEVHFNDARGVVRLKQQEDWDGEIINNYFDVKMDERFFDNPEDTDEVSFYCEEHEGWDDPNKKIKIRLEKPLKESEDLDWIKSVNIPIDQMVSNALSPEYYVKKYGVYEKTFAVKKPNEGGYFFVFELGDTIKEVLEVAKSEYKRLLWHGDNDYVQEYGEIYQRLKDYVYSMENPINESEDFDWIRDTEEVEIGGYKGIPKDTAKIGDRVRTSYGKEFTIEEISQASSLDDRWVWSRELGWVSREEKNWHNPKHLVKVNINESNDFD